MCAAAVLLKVTKVDAPQVYAFWAREAGRVETRDGSQESGNRLDHADIVGGYFSVRNVESDAAAVTRRAARIERFLICENY